SKPQQSFYAIPMSSEPPPIDDSIKSLEDFKKKGAYFSDDDKKPVTFINLKEMNIKGPALVHLKSVADSLTGLDLDGTPITDEGLVHVAELKNLETLSLNRTRISDAGLQHLQGLNKLKKLNLGRTQLTGPGLQYLKGLNELKQLSLEKTQIGDAGLQYLPG